MDIKSYEKKLYFKNNVPGFEVAPAVRIRACSQGVRRVARSRHPAEQFHEDKKFEGYELLTEGKVSAPMIIIIQKGSVSFYRTFHGPRLPQPDQDQDGKDVCFSRFEAGQIFCSLSTFGLPAPEPFTARVSSDVCSYFVATQDTIPRIPQSVFNEIKMHIKDLMRPLLCYSGAFCGTDHFDPEHRLQNKKSPRRSPTRSLRSAARVQRPNMRPQTAWNL